jgi:hypothetical protein
MKIWGKKSNNPSKPKKKRFKNPNCFPLPIKKEILLTIPNLTTKVEQV